MLQEIKKENLRLSNTKEGKLIHYHIHLFEDDGSMFWKLKTENKKVDQLYFKAELSQ